MHFQDQSLRLSSFANNCSITIILRVKNRKHKTFQKNTFLKLV